MLHARPGLAAAVEGSCRQPQLLLRAVGSDGCYRRLLLPQMAAPAQQQPTISNQQPGEIRQARAQFGWRRKGWWLIDPALGKNWLPRAGSSWKPANGFEPMAFALQKRCSTTELSRRGSLNLLSSLSLCQIPRPRAAVGSCCDIGFWPAGGRHGSPPFEG